VDGSAAMALGEGYYAGATTSDGDRAQSKRQLERERLTPDARGVALVMVGLPARGKSFISHKLERFLLWKGLSTRMFNVGSYRRQGTDAEQSGRSDFFDKNNTTALAAREAAASAALKDMFEFLDGGGQFAIFDATNSVVSRRAHIIQSFRSHVHKYNLVFVEVICSDTEVVEANMMNKIRHSPDFHHMSLEKALEDIKKRIANYEAVYETVGDDEGSYIKLFNLSTKVLANQCYGRISRSILPYLMGVHIGTRPIWLVRAGVGEGNPQSCDHPSARLSGLSGEGLDFAQALGKFVHARAAQHWHATGREPEPTRVFTSTMARAVASACHISDGDAVHSSALNALDKGTIGIGWWDVECRSDSLPWDEVSRRHPEFWEQFQRDPLKKCFPGGESFMDVIQRLEGLLIEVESSTRPVLVVSHITVLQLLVAYFRGLPMEEAWKLAVPRHCVFEALPTLGGGFTCSEHCLRADEVCVTDQTC